MRNDYLWDGSGEPDPELEKLERALGQFQISAEAPRFPLLPEGARDGVRKKSPFLLGMPRFAAVSALAAAMALATALLWVRVPPVVVGPGWDVARLAGAPVVGSSAVRNGGAKATLRVGEVLVTDGSSRASVEVAEIGELYVDPGSRVRLIETGSNRKRIRVEVGTIHAAIWAPPGEFVVDTPSATAVDLGCAYTLKVAPDGSGTLRTTLGWVGFHTSGRDSFIPAGAMCLTRPGLGPGTPFLEDSSNEFRAALDGLDFRELRPALRHQALEAVLSEARRQDAFTLWHLLVRVSDEERPLVYERLAALVHAPAGTTREGTLRLDPAMMDTWWNAFGLGDITVWRFWEQQEAPPLKKAAN
jgi:hypothetical protein